MRFDYIVVGAGVAGCIIASRLSEDPANRVLLLEAGGKNDRLIVRMPAGTAYAYQTRALNWGYRSGPEPQLGNRELDEKRGRGIGGSAAINAMVFNRGNPNDFEDWKRSGLSEWGYANCLPYFRRMETFGGGANEWRGGDGPLRIRPGQADHILYDSFISGGEQAGHTYVSDHNAFRQEGVHREQAYIGNGLRWSAARGYLIPALERPNLTVWTDCYVNGIVIENGTARGVNVTRGGEDRQITCEREVVMCAGAFNTPQLLMLSGIGPADHLKALDIPLKLHVPRLGKDLENHPGFVLTYSIDERYSLARELGLVNRAALGLQWLWNKTGLAASNFYEVGAFLRTRSDLAAPNIQIEFMGLIRTLTGRGVKAAPGFTVYTCLTRPRSRGEVTLRSRDPRQQPSLVFNHLAERSDITDFIEAFRTTRAFFAQPAWEKLNAREIDPGPTVQTDADIEAFLRRNLGTHYHPSGTCKMGTGSEAVVDPAGRLRGIEGLRVADASVLPNTVCGNISASVAMVAEKLSDAIRGRTPLPPSNADYYRAVPA